MQMLRRLEGGRTIVRVLLFVRGGREYFSEDTLKEICAYDRRTGEPEEEKYDAPQQEIIGGEYQQSEREECQYADGD